MQDLFLLASKNKFRFDTRQGGLMVEDLWELPLKTTSPSRTSLNDVATTLSTAIIRAEATNFVDDAPVEDETVKQKFAIVLEIIRIRKAENAAERARAATAERNQRILEIIANKEDAALFDKSIDELRALIGQSS